MKKVIKKLASLLMVTVFVITGTTFQMLAGALSESVINGKQKLYISYYPYSYNFSGSGLGTSIYGQFVKINVGSANGEYAYCMDAEADSGITGTSIFTAEDFNLSDWVKRNYTSNQIKLMKYAAIYTIKNASETKYGYSNEVENIASQIINWTILHNWFNTSSESSVLNVYTANMPSSVASNVKACYNKIKEQILSHKTIPSFAVGKGQTPTPKKMTTNADGAYLKAVSKNGKYVYNGSQTAEARFMLTNGKFELTELPTGKYTITEINKAEGYLPKTQVKTITVTKDATASAEFVNKVIVGNVTLTKVDEDYPENKLTGAVFTVYKSDKKTVVGTMKETETGVYSLEGLVYGDYYVQETKAPEYFVRDVNFYYFQIVNDGETVEVSNDELGKGTFINSPQKGEIKIVKTSYDNKVEGIHFEVTGKTYTGQTFKKTYTTDKNGIIRINDLRAGEYNIHEVNDEASAGYLLPEDKQLTIDRDGAMLVAEMHNSKLPDNPPTGASEDSFTQTAVIIISMVMMSAAVVLAFPLSKRKRKR